MEDFVIIKLSEESTSSFTSKLYNLYLDQKLVDTKLILADGEIFVHSIIVAIESNTFYRMLVEQTGVEKTLLLTQFTKPIMRLILDFCYRGYMAYDKIDEPAVMSAAKFFELKIKTNKKNEFNPDENKEISQNILSPNISKKDSTGTPESEVSMDESIIEIRNDVIIEISDESSPDLSSPIRKTIHKSNDSIHSTKLDHSDEGSVKSLDFLSLEFGGTQENKTDDDPTFLQQSDENEIPDDINVNINSLIQQKNVRDSSENRSTSKLTPTDASHKSKNNTSSNSTTKGWSEKKRNINMKVCVLCNEEQTNIHAHLKSAHQQHLVNRKKFICLICNNKFQFKIIFNHHKKICE